MSIDRLVRLAVVLVALAAGLQTVSPAHAARLGPLSVLSERGQPFRAEVEVEEPSADTLSAEPAIVTPETYRDLGLTFPASLRGARVTMERRDGDGRPVIRIVGRGPTEGPELIVVMSLSTQAGRHLRSYRLDLDAPPAVARVAPPPPADAAAPTAAPTAEPPLPTTRLAPSLSTTLNPEPARMEPPRDVPRVEALPSSPAPVALPSTQLPPPSSSVPPPARIAPMPGSSPPSRAPVTTTAVATPSIDVRLVETARPESATVTIARGDTAASIANRFRPADVTEAQAAMALYRNNPAAFDGSVARPRPGATVRIPDAGQMRALPASIAEQAMRGPAATAPSGRPPAVVSSQRGDRLHLSAGGTGRGKQSDARGSAANREVAFDAAMTEARSRIQQLESIVDGLKRLIEEREKQIAALAGELQVAGVAIAPAATPVGEMPVPPAANAPPVAASPVASMAPPSDATPALGAAAATMLPEPTRRAPIPMPEPEPEPWYTDPMLLGIAGAAVLLLALLAVWMRGSKSRPRPGKSAGRFAAAR
ncbi:MAG: hypothetical protein EHM87_13420 [Burkholderiales bacterium]|nr:MAG: hypothetical protein EHM87_13420 [Burkholderiales bacterium]